MLVYGNMISGTQVRGFEKARNAGSARLLISRLHIISVLSVVVLAITGGAGT
ncbi:MAG TPA: hypothetical protein VMT82_00015 [candidate division Zixibacteria bacterium]|nr:hypothetical protein [candidate division Zixibacteria bacterium]